MKMKKIKSLSVLSLLSILITIPFCVECIRDKSPFHYIEFVPGTHVYQGFFRTPPNRIYKFNNVPYDLDLIISFPWESIRSELSTEVLDSMEIEYWIFTSPSDAELAMVERLELSSLWLGNMLDYPLQDGPIGDNCWYEFETNRTVSFIRNNVLVFINQMWSTSSITNFVEMVARKVDSALINHTKVSYLNLLSAPKIHSVELTSGNPSNWEQSVTLKINASDPQNQQLYFRKYGAGLAIISLDGILRISLYKPLHAMNDSNKARIKVWVWNEAHFVSLVTKVIQFSN